MQRWGFLHSLFLPMLMGNKMLAQSDSLSAVLWDAARAVGVGMAFVWLATPAPVQVLSIVMALHFIVVIRAHWQRVPGLTHTVSEEIWRMIYTLLLLVTLRTLLRLSGTYEFPVLFAAGALAWWEAVLMVRQMILMGAKFPPFVEQFTLAMFRLNSKRLARWAGMQNGEKEKDGDGRDGGDNGDGDEITGPD